eukprot:gene29546-5895_t
MSVPCAYELERIAQINVNKARLAEMGLLKQQTILNSFKAVKNTGQYKRKERLTRPIRSRYLYIAQYILCLILLERTAQPIMSPRRSRRVQGSAVEYSHREIDENDRPSYDDPLVDLMDRKGSIIAPAAPSEQQQADIDISTTTNNNNNNTLADRKGSIIAPAAPSEQQQAEIQMHRCNSQGRGSVYDSHVGITCHFCRQKKLCGEENCPRCQNRDANQECIGKTDCSRCHAAFGRFCRACLLIRYGSEMECVRKQMADGTWLCPHCYEEENPDAGWMCNSSICMKKRGLRPTGIAIYDAQAQLLARGGVQAAVRSGGALEADNSAQIAVPDEVVKEEVAEPTGRGCRRGGAQKAQGPSVGGATDKEAALPPKAPKAPKTGVPAPARSSRSRQVGVVAAAAGEQ